MYKTIALLLCLFTMSLRAYDGEDIKLIDRFGSYHDNKDLIEDINKLQSKYHLRISKKRDCQLGGIISRDFKFHGGNQPIVTQTGLMFGF